MAVRDAPSRQAATAPPPVTTPDELSALLNRLGLTTGAAARCTQTPPRTWRRWLDGTQEPLPSAVLLLRLADEVPGVLAWLVERS
jgi:DNA-binding transcriptional regulator YiaG